MTGHWRTIGWRRNVVAIALALAASGASARAADVGSIAVTNDGEGLGPTPVVARLDRPIAPGDYALLAAGEDGKLLPPVPAEVFADQGTTYFAAIFPGVAKGRAVYRIDGPIVGGGGKAEWPRIEFRPTGRNIDVRLGEHPFTTYRVDSGPKPILYPLIGPTGAGYTRSFPMETVPGEDVDHPHQRSFWFTYGLVNGVDFWTEGAGHGSIRETSRPVAHGGLVVGVLKTTDDWLAPDGKKLMEDTRILNVFAVGADRVIDYDVTLKATNGPVTFGDTKEGMFGVRVATSMDVKKGRPGGRIVNAEGLTDGSAWGKRSAWVDYSGPVAGQVGGIAILDHPENFGQPTPWHVREYGLFAANPFGRHDFGLTPKAEPTVLEAGKSLHFRYRVILHGAVAPVNYPVGKAYESFARPPKVEILAN